MFIKIIETSIYVHAFLCLYLQGMGRSRCSAAVRSDTASTAFEHHFLTVIVVVCSLTHEKVFFKKVSMYH